MTDAQWKPTPGRDAMTRDGRRVTKIEHNNVLGNAYVLRGRVNGDCLTWTEDGAYYKEAVPHQLDLVCDADPLPAEPDEDGWIKHDGGPCPVPPDTIVDIRCANGAEIKSGRKASHWEWENGRQSMKSLQYRITHYRIVQPASPAIPSPVRQRTVTEIVPGPYGRLVVTGARSGKVYLALSREASQGMFALDADELDALAATATELARALREMGAASTLTQIADAMEAGE